MKQFILVLFFIFSVQSQSQKLQTYSFEQVEQLVGEQPRPILLYFYTDWCVYCRRLQNTTFEDKKVIEQLNKNYYVVFFNGSSKDEVLHKGKRFRFVPTGMKSGYHELVYHYLDNRQEVYPTLIFLNEHFNELSFLQTYLPPKDLLKIL